MENGADYNYDYEVEEESLCGFVRVRVLGVKFHEDDVVLCFGSTDNRPRIFGAKERFTGNITATGGEPHTPRRHEDDGRGARERQRGPMTVKQAQCQNVCDKLMASLLISSCKHYS